MKDIRLYTLLLSILFTSIKPKETSTIYNIIDALANGTAAFVDLETYVGNYVYFSFDFVYHGELVPASKDVAFFSMKSEPDVIKNDSVAFTFSENDWQEIDDPEVFKNWTKTQIEYNEKDDPEYEVTNYYQFSKKDNKMKTLLLRVSLGEKRNGTLTVENIIEIPPHDDDDGDDDGHDKDKSKAGYISISTLLYLVLFLLNIW